MKNVSPTSVSLFIAGIIISVIPLILKNYFILSDSIYGVIQGLGIGMLIAFLMKTRKDMLLNKKDD